MKLITVVGARPQFIKEAVIQKELQKYSDIEHIFVHSGQHYDRNMSEIFLHDFELKMPDHNLNVNGLSHAGLTAKIMTRIEKIYKQENPDFILVYGDTNTTLAAALTAKKMKIKIGHIEAGLRQSPKDMPEEINRVLTDHLSDFLFVTSNNAITNLTRENITKNIFNVGDVMYDIYLKLKHKFDYKHVRNYNLKKYEYVIVTLHRDFNVDNKDILKNILESLTKINHIHKIVLVIHPRTKKNIIRFNLDRLLVDIKTIPPQGYIEMLSLIKYCKFVITDSGGLQKESYFSGKNAFVIMPDTAWSELIDERVNILCNSTDIFERVMNDSFNKSMPSNIYGQGDAGFQIIDVIRKIKT